MRHLKLAVLVSLATLWAPQAFACFTVYDRSNVVVYNALTPPIDMSRQIHERLPRVFPAGHMVFGWEVDCPETDARLLLAQQTLGIVPTPPRPARRDRQ